MLEIVSKQVVSIQVVNGQSGNNKSTPDAYVTVTFYNISVDARIRAKKYVNEYLIPAVQQVVKDKKQKEDCK